MSLDWFKADWNRTILFAAGGEGRKHLLPGGWGGEEPIPGVWSTSSLARMAFRLAQPRHQTFLAMDLLPFVPCPETYSQVIEVHLNGQRLGECLMAGAERRVVVFPVEDRTLLARPFSILSFVLPGARSPESLGLGSDSRSLGIRLYGLRWVDVWYDCQFGGRVPTTASKGASHHLLYGWSEPEPEFTWSEGPSAMLVLRAPDGESDMVFQAKVQPFVPRLDLPPQRVRLSVNDRPVGEFTFRDPASRVIEARIPRNCVDRDRLLFLRFDVESPRRPADFGFGHDSRELGFALFEFCLELQEFARRGRGLKERYAGTSRSRPGAASAVSEFRQPPGIFFNTGESPQSALVYGWDKPSEEGAAMLRSPAILAADLTGCPSPLDMVCHFTVRGAEPRSEVDVRVEASGLLAGSFTLTGPNPAPQSVRLWPMTLRQSGLTYVSFEWSAEGGGALVPVLRSVEFVRPDGHLPPFEPIASGASFRFRPGAPGERLLTDGWHGVTEDGALSLGAECGLVLPVFNVKLPLNVDLEVGSAGRPGVDPGAHVVVEINGRAANCFAPDSVKKVRVTVSPVDLLAGRPLAIRFRPSSCEALGASSRGAKDSFGRSAGGRGIPFLFKRLRMFAPLDAGRSA